MTTSNATNTTISKFTEQHRKTFFFATERSHVAKVRPEASIGDIKTMHRMVKGAHERATKNKHLGEMNMRAGQMELLRKAAKKMHKVHL